jgi:hypothetical protein
MGTAGALLAIDVTLIFTVFIFQMIEIRAIFFW